MSQETTEPQLMTASQVAGLLLMRESTIQEYARRGLLLVRESTVQDYARRGLLPSIKLGRHRRFLRSDVDATIAELRSRPRG